MSTSRSIESETQWEWKLHKHCKKSTFGSLSLLRHFATANSKASFVVLFDDNVHGARSWSPRLTLEIYFSSLVKNSLFLLCNRTEFFLDKCVAIRLPAHFSVIFLVTNPESFSNLNRFWSWGLRFDKKKSQKRFFSLKAKFAVRFHTDCCEWTEKLFSILELATSRLLVFLFIYSLALVSSTSSFRAHEEKYLFVVVTAR